MSTDLSRGSPSVPVEGESAHDRADRRRRAAHIRICLLVGGWSSIFAVVYVLIGAPLLLSAITVACTVLGLGTTVALARGMSLRRAGNLMIIGMFGVCATTPFYYGGVDFAGNAWLLSVPLAAMSMRNVRTGILTTMGLVLVCVASYLTELAGWLPEPIVGPEARSFIAAVNLPITGMLLLAIGRMHDHALRSKTFRERAANADLRAEIARRIAVQQDLEQTRTELVDAARFAGRAEVATGALHNIGNALTSLTVSATRASALVRQLRLERLNDLAQLLETHDDPRIATYTRALAADLEKTRALMQAEMDGAVSGAEHVASVVAIQQEHARYGGLAEEVALSQEVARALVLVGLKPGASVTVRGEAQVTVDRHRLLQILGNLLKNARDAVGELGERGRIDVLITGGDPARVCVSDNGVGIGTDTIQRIFAHGFTTKSHGSGFGLHASALAAQELGGSLTASSEGDGLGARFVLTIPASPPVAVAS